MPRLAFPLWLLALACVALLGVGSCEPPRSCTGSWQCRGGEVCSDLDRPGECVQAQCSDDSQCAAGSECRGVSGPAGGTCLALSCGDETACPEDSYCAGLGFCGVPGCQRPPGQCLPQECGFDDDCPRGARCEGSSVCPPDVVCVWEGAPGICVGDRCRGEEDCGLGAVCHDGFCRIVPPAPPPGGAS